MSIKVTAICDECHKELEIGKDEKAIDYDGWGTVFDYDEDYCPECWPDYCDSNSVDIKTGKDL
jgi:hypothetical protein